MDAVRQDGDTLARQGVEFDAIAGVVRDDVAILDVDTTDLEVGPAEVSRHEQAGAAVAKGCAVDVHTDRVANDRAREAGQPQAHLGIARDDIALVLGRTTDDRVVAVRFETGAGGDQRSVRDRQGSACVGTDPVSADRGTRRGELDADAIGAIAGDDVPVFRRTSTDDRTVRPHCDAVRVVRERGRSTGVDTDPVGGDEAVDGGYHDAAAIESADGKATDLTTGGEQFQPVDSSACQRAVEHDDRRTRVSGLERGIQDHGVIQDRQRSL